MEKIGKVPLSNLVIQKRDVAWHEAFEGMNHFLVTMRREAEAPGEAENPGEMALAEAMAEQIAVVLHDFERGIDQAPGEGMGLAGINVGAENLMVRAEVG